jgi:hypothetical protein
MSTIAAAAIVAKVVELLTAAPALAGVPVLRNRLRPLQDNVTRAIVVRKANSDPLGVPLLGQGVDYQTQVRVECYARGSASQTAHEAPDALLLAVHAVMAVNPTLQGLAMGIDPPRIGWDEDDMDSSLGVAVAQYPVMHRTAPNSLAAAA